MASASVSAPTGRRPLEPLVAIAALLALALWPVQIEIAFGLPAHPLLIHVPVVFVPILGVAVLALALWRRHADRFLLPVAAFSVVTMAATLLAAGAGEAFEERLERPGLPPVNPTLQDHEDAGGALRFGVVLLTFVLVAWLFARRRPPAVSIVLRVLAVLLAVSALFFVVRTGHLGAKMAWDEPRQGAPPALPGGG
jgi:uncharacterized membrane protein